MTAEGTNKTRILHFLIKIADKCTSGNMTAGNFVYGALLLLACGRIQDSDKACNPTLFENTLDGHVILLLTDKRKDTPFRILSLIAVKNFQSSLVQRDTDYLRDIQLMASNALRENG